MGFKPFWLVGVLVCGLSCEKDEDAPSTSSAANAGTGSGASGGSAGGSGGLGVAGGSAGSDTGGTGGGGESGADTSGGSSGSGGSAGGSGGSTGGAGGNTGGSGGNTGGSGGNTGGSAGEAGSTGGATSGTGGQAGETNEPIKVVVLGSSSAAAKNLDQTMYGGDPAAKGWVALYTESLQTDRPGSVVVSLALAGASTYSALPTGTPDTANRPTVDTQRNITAALAESPDAVILSYPSGGNLETGGYTVQEIIDNLHTIVDEATGAGVPVWVATSQPLNETTTTTQTIALSQSLSDRTKADFAPLALDFWTPLTNGDGTVRPEYQLTDGQHPNAAGHQLLFQVVEAADIPGAVSGQ